MAIKLTISLDPSSADLLAGYGAGAVVRVQRDTTSAFPAPTTPTLAPLANPIPIVSGTENYETWDASGTASLWYRSRYENAGATNVSDWSAGFQPGQDTYATVDDVLRTHDIPPEDSAKLARLDSLLRTVTDELTDEIGYDFVRHPAVTGTETRYFTVLDDDYRLHVHGRDDGIAGILPGSIVSVKYGQYGTALTTVVAADYRTETDPDGAIYHIDLSGVGTTLQEFPTGRWEVEVIAAFGHATPPARIREATVARVRQLLSADPSVSGGLPGPVDLGFGTAIVSAGMRWPDVTFRAIDHYRRKFSACYI